MSEKNRSGLVYSSEFGRMCPDCEQPSDRCCCKKKNSAKPSDGIVRISRETKGRKGSGVTIVSGIICDEEKLKQIATELKKKCGAGGAVKNGTIEIQGEHREKLMLELVKMGYRAKSCGG